MTDNGKGKEVLKVMLHDGKLSVHFGEVNMALVSHAFRLASLELDNLICLQQQQQKKSDIEVPKTVLDKMRRGMKL